ncbi:hypothetical protein JD844_015346 [Phrynosoma platyrhinos]|uniref:Secreted protein n=1 Tax=Phrynosoma platyrhinos TaxID=52577 RepID=A0ABQ7SJ18_PHRPL|nr:hypothetical protein JD844_015346 [Phrynosoma platyrhinos]
MWRLFPYAAECLLPLLSFSCVARAWHMCSLGPTLAVAFQDPETVTYRVVYYNLIEQSCSEHSPEDDAQDDITGGAPGQCVCGEGTPGPEHHLMPWGRLRLDRRAAGHPRDPAPFDRPLLLPQPEALCLGQPGWIREDLGHEEPAVTVRSRSRLPLVLSCRRHLKLNTIPECLAFANHWGDLLVGIERHLYLIHHSKYLPNYYKMKVGLCVSVCVICWGR